ncbi:cytochrome P450 [Podospora didyma]|uniref:Cytochrome P450 n=1 Tax=Podospora didyma TaxID=330526 RepID=A0AAE0U3L3_9PEZI|nr:cytochrome P450 [Podospora didyma]
MTSLTVYAAAALVLGSVYFLFVKKPKSQLPLPPGPPTLPILGNVHQAPKSHPWLQYFEWNKTYGPVVHLNMAGQPVIVLGTSKAAHDLLAKKGATFSDRPHFVVAYELALQGMHMLLRPYDERFKLHQRLEAPLLSEKAAKAYLAIEGLESKQLLFDLLKDSGRTINPHGHLERMTASIIYSLFYGHRVRTENDAILVQAHAVNHEFGQLVQVGKYLVDSFPVLNKLPAFLAPWKAEAAAHWKNQCSLHVGNLERGLATPSWNVAKQMQKAVDTQGIAMSVEELALNVGIMADAALDATSETLSWFVLACITEGNRGGNWIAKAQKDLDTVVGRYRLPSLDDQPALPYIEAIVEELLRWRPAGAAGVPHFTKIESTYEGFRIPANSVVIANHWSITREEAVFGPDVEAFVPERWLGDGKHLPTAGFGYGRRICPGRHIARNVLWLNVSRILWAFNVEPELTKGGEPVKVDTKGADGLVTHPLPFKACFTARGDWVGDIVTTGCDTWSVNCDEMLDDIQSTGVFK